jgi:hypothetical protein
MFYPWFKMLICVKRAAACIDRLLNRSNGYRDKQDIRIASVEFFQLDNRPRFVARPIKIFLNIKKIANIFFSCKKKCHSIYLIK